MNIDDADLASCVQCGLCLPHCPTWRVTGEEAKSPRGRIALMRSVQWDDAPFDDGTVEAMESCVQCRGCEPACPSGVPFGRMMSAVRAELATSAGRGHEPWWRRLGYVALGHPRLLRAGGRVAALGQRARLVPARLGLPPLSFRPPRITLTEPIDPVGEVWLVRGCVMDVVQREVHQATVDLLALAGYRVRLAQPHEGCCGALAHHAGLEPVAHAQSARLMAAMGGDLPVVVDAAGCGAQLKELGHQLGTAESARFSARVVDACELLAGSVERLPAPRRRAGRVAVQDPCHLRHVQRVHTSVRTLLAPYADVVELDDDGLCCGAGGAFAMVRPDDAAAIRERKLAAIRRADAPLVASANPGCDVHLSAAGVAVRHPLQIVHAAIMGGEPGPDGEPMTGGRPDGR